jgi:hypothetical protein
MFGLGLTHLAAAGGIASRCRSLVSRRNPRAGLVILRQTFVRRYHRPTMCTTCCSLTCAPAGSGIGRGEVVRAGPATLPGRARTATSANVQRLCGTLAVQKAPKAVQKAPPAPCSRSRQFTTSGASRSPWRRPQKCATGHPRVGYRDDDALRLV